MDRDRILIRVEREYIIPVDEIKDFDIERLIELDFTGINFADANYSEMVTEILTEFDVDSTGEFELEVIYPPEV